MAANRRQWKGWLAAVARTWTTELSQSIAEDTRRIAAAERARASRPSLEDRVTDLERWQNEVSCVLDDLTAVPDRGG